MLPIALVVGLLVPSASAGDDLGSLLDAIPDIETTRPETPEEESKKQESDLDADLGQVSLPRYLQDVQAHLLGTMDLSKGLVRKHGAETIRLRLEISSSGNISGMAALALTGDKKTDKKVIEAVRAAAPLPAPPIIHRRDALRGVVVSIPLGQVGG